MPTSSVPSHRVDLALSHPLAFTFTFTLAVFYVLIPIAYEAKFSISMNSLRNAWVFLYIMLSGLLMLITTGMALQILYKQDGALRVDWIPESIALLAAAVFGVFGFDVLVRRFVVGFGENQFELAKILQACLDQTVAARLKCEAEQ